MKINGREVLARFQFGSKLYGLETKDSDEDFRAIICPNWDELYLAARRQDKIKIGDFAEIEGIDYSIFNIMGLSTQMAIGSPYWIEILWSKKVITNETFRPLWDYMVEHRCDLSKMQLKAFWQNHIKAAKKHLKLFEKKGKPSLLHHALRHIYTIQRFAKFEDYGRAICYDNDKDSVEYKNLMLLKNEVKEDELLLDAFHIEVEEQLKNIGEYYEFYNKEYTGKHHAYIKEEISKIVKASV